VTWRKRLAVATAIIAVLAVAAIAALPLLVHSPAVQRAVERRISALAGGEVRFGSSSLRLLPLPRAEIRDVTIRVPDALEGRAAAIAVKLSLADLVTGNVRLTAVHIEQPAFEVHLSPGGGAVDPFAVYREALGPVVDALVRDAAGMSLEIVGGKLEVHRAGRRLVSLQDLAAEAEVAADAVDARASGASDLWRTAQARLRVTPGSLAATAKLQVTGLQTASLFDAAPTDGAIAVLPGAIDASLDGETDGRSKVRAALTASSPKLALARGARSFEVGAVSVAVEAVRDAETLALTLRDLKAGELLPRAIGSLRAKADGAAPAFALQAPALDLARVREAALALAGDLDAVRTAAGIIRGGTLQSLAINSSGGAFTALAEARSIHVEAKLDKGELDFPDFGIVVKNGQGPLVLAEGTLRGSGLSGTIGRSSFRDGTLALELAPAVVLRDMRAAIDTDLGEAHAIALRALGPAEGAALAGIEALRGRAAGSFAFERVSRRPSFSVELRNIRANGRYRGVPFPIAIDAGEIRHTRDGVRLRGVSGTVGRSRVSALSADFALGADQTVRSASGGAALDLDELYPWLASLGRLRPALREVKSLAGTASIRLARLSGPLARPAALDYEVAVKPAALRATLAELPEPLKLSGGEAIITRDTTRFDHVGAALLDARVSVSGTVTDYASPDRRLDLTLADGAAGAATLDWLRERWEVDARALPRPPVALDSGRLQWSAAEHAERSAEGVLRLAGDARADFDLTWGPEVLDIRRLAVKDADTDATASLRWTPDRAELAFNGRVDNRSIVRVMARRPDVQASIQGDFRAVIDLAEPRRSTAKGTLTGEGLKLMEDLGSPVAIEKIQVEATGDAATIRDTVLKIGGQRIAVSGTLAIRPDTFAIDLSAAADELDAVDLLEPFLRGGERSKRKRSAWDIPVEGRFAIAAKSISFGLRTVQSVAATVQLAPKRIVVDVSEARACEVSAPFTATFTPGDAVVSGRIEARGAPLDQLVPCVLGGDQLVMTGRLDADLRYTASGPPGELGRQLSGTFQGTARNGRIKHPSVPRILSREVVAARVNPDEAALATTRGLDYSAINVTGRLSPGRVQIERSTLDGPMLGIGMTGEIDLDAGQLDLRGVVAPFGEATAAARRIPLFGRLFRARIVGAPFSVTGDWRDPRVQPLAPSAIAASLLDLLRATFNAPIELFTAPERTP